MGELIVGQNDLATVKPELVCEWNIDRNGDLTPTSICGHSSKKVWWKCSNCNYEWQAIVSNRVNGSGCPACKNNTTTVIRGLNDFATTCPDLLKEWDFEKNTISPFEISKGSHKRVWWRILYKNPETNTLIPLSWEATVKGRVKGNGCPFLAGNGSILMGFNDLSTTHPDIAKEWLFSKNIGALPNNVAAGSHKKVWWKCSICGKEWQSTIKDRTSGTGCPFCTKFSRTSFPEQAIYYYVKKCYPDAMSAFKEIFENKMEIDIFIPSIKVGIEYDGEYWHSTDGSTKREALKYDICRSKGVFLIRVKENLEERNVEFCDSLVFCNFSHKNYLAIDNAVAELFSLFKYRGSIDINTERDEICIREQYSIGAKKNSLAGQFPKIAQQWHPTKNGNLRPEMFSPNANYKAWWLCPDCKGVWQARIVDRTSKLKNGGGKCAICTSHKIKCGFNDLETWCKNNNSNLLKLWDYRNNNDLPSNYLPNSEKIVFWKCDVCGESWRAPVVNATKWVGCPKCWKRKRKKTVQQFDLKGVFIEEFETAADAANKLKFDLTSIRRACRGEKPTYKGFIWKYK